MAKVGMDERVREVAAALMQEWDVQLWGEGSLDGTIYYLYGRTIDGPTFVNAQYSLSFQEYYSAVSSIKLIRDGYLKILKQIGAKPKAKGGAYVYTSHWPKTYITNAEIAQMASPTPEDAQKLCDKLNDAAEQVMFPEIYATTATTTTGPLVWQEIEETYKQMKAAGYMKTASSTPVAPAKVKPPQKLNSIADLYKDRPWMDEPKESK